MGDYDPHASPGLGEGAHGSQELGEGAHASHELGEGAHASETACIDVFAPAHNRSGENWGLMRALHFSFPDLVYLQDILPNANNSVVYRQTLVPIHTVVAARMTRGRDPIPEVLVQFTKTDYETSAWISEKFVPK